MILGIVIHGLYLIQKPELPLIMATFIVVLILYGYGYWTKDLCFHPVDGDKYHALLHVVSSIGHHLVVL